MKPYALLLTLALAYPAQAQETNLSEIERRIDVLSGEIERLKLGAAAEEPAELVSELGFGPAASKVYKKGAQRVSVGGYGEMVYESFSKRKQNAALSNKKDKADFLRGVLYVGYKYNDWITLNSEFEFEHASTGKTGEASVEMAQIDMKPWGDLFAFRAGLMLMPVGLTNEVHEPTTFHGVKRPSVEQNIYPTTWRENGAGVFGTIGPVTYRSYAVTGLQAIANGANTAPKGFSASKLRSGRSSGSKSLANDWAWVGRADIAPLEGTLLGLSVYHGGVDQAVSTAPVSLTLWDVHAKLDWRGLEAKGMYVAGKISNVRALNAAQTAAGQNRNGNKSVGEDIFGGYLEVAYDVLRWLPDSRGHMLSPFFRYERYDTQNRVPSGFTVDPANSRTEYTFGATYKPISRVAVKFDHQILGNQAHTGVSQTNLGIGYIF